MEITLQLDDSEARSLLERLRERVKNLKPVLERIGLFYHRSVMENFKAEESPDGKVWERLSATTMMMKLGQKDKKGRRYGFRQDGGLSAKGKRYTMGKRILWEHGDLEQSVHHQANDTSVTIGTGGHIPYAAVHQFGVKAGYKKMKVSIPARPYLAVNQGKGLALADKDRDMIMEQLREHLIGDLQ